MGLSVEDRVLMCKTMIENACISCGLNLTIRDGKIGFVDQEAKQIVAIWTPTHSLSELDND